MLKNKTILSLGVAAGLLFACSDDDNVTRSSVENPDSYEFTRDGASTVSFSGQTTRILMGNELNDALTDNSKSESDLLNMFAHQAGNDDFSDAALNASGKSLRSKTAASKDYFSANSTDANAIRNQFDGWISAQVNEVFPNWDQNAVEGQAGQIQEAGGGSVRYVNAKGLEYDQAVGKSLIGALMTDQMLNNYLSPAVLDEASNVEDNNNEVLEAGSNYTTMEHKWDEAFGYLYGNDDPVNPQLGQDDFLNKYLARVENDEDFTGIAGQVYNAFKLGRAAIVAGDYDLRDQQANVIREEISKVIGIRAVYYLQQGKNVLDNDKAAAFHDLSEGFGFIMSLQFTREPGTGQPYFSKDEVDTYLAQLLSGNGFWDITPATLDDISQQIANRFDFTVEQAAP
jgi:hypothetical protein